MRKSLYLMTALALLLAGCGSDNGETDETAQAPMPVTIVEFNANAADFVDKTVVISGTVDHVCKHGGKRMFIMGDDPSDRVKIESGDKIAAFDVALEGSAVRVVAVGRVETIDAAYLDTWEAEARAGGEADESQNEADEHAETGEGEDHHANELRQIAHMREQLAESGEDQLTFYHLECQSFEEL